MLGLPEALPEFRSAYLNTPEIIMTLFLPVRYNDKNLEGEKYPHVAQSKSKRRAALS